MKIKVIRAGAVKSWAVTLVMSTTLLCGLAQPGRAGLAPLEVASPASVQRGGDMDKVQKTLENKAVRERLRAFGLSDAEIERRLSKLSEREIHQLATELEALNPGGLDVGGVLVLAILVLLFIYLLDRI